MRNIVIATFAAMLTTAAAAAPQTAQVSSNQMAAAAAQVAAPVAGSSTQAVEKKACRQLPSTGSRHRNRVCLTAKEWEKVEQGQD